MIQGSVNREDNKDSSRSALRLYIALTRTYRTLLEKDQRNIRSYGLNPTEFGVLELLHTKGPHPLQPIGDKILITSGTITYVIDKLEKKGLLVRRPCERDRRIVYAELTETGRSMMDGILPGHYRSLAAALDGLSPSEQEQAIALLKKINIAGGK